MKLLHSADLHMKPETADQALQSLRVLYDTAVRDCVDLIVIAGDLWDCVIRNTGGSRFPELLEAVRRLADFAPLVMIYGTPTHDAEGSLDVFPTLESKFGITILEPGRAYFLTEQRHVWEKDFVPLEEIECAVLFGVPEPSKKWLAPYFDSKAETEQAVRDGLRALFNGLGAIRRQYPTLPCVLLYHGQVGGARLQNGDMLDNGSGIRPSVDDLAAVGADYIALGDIHEPQQVGTLPAYYPGSAYPINFGETHEAGANLVEVEVGYSGITRVLFGHPVNRKLSSRWPEPVQAKDVAPFERTWIEITCTKEESVSINVADIEAGLFRNGAAPGSRVTLNVLPTETVRAGEIATKTKLRDKVTVWGENSAKTIPASVLEKADQVEAEAAASGAVGRGSTITLTRLILRGAIGLQKKSGLEEIDLDLENIDEGLVALIGNNGAGKTTILENMHPWPGLLTRDGVLKDHFYLRDSFRDLYWTDESTGAKYRALITIDAGIASGATEYFLYKDGLPLPGIEGRKEGYVEAVNKIFGIQDLYLRSAFVTQRQPKGFSDLGDATPKERKVLFSALCGLEYFEEYKTRAKAKGDSADAIAHTKEVEIVTLQGRLPNADELVADINTHAEVLDSARTDLQALLEVGKHHAAKADALSAQVATNRGKAQQAADAGALVRDSESKAHLAIGYIAAAQQALAKRPEAVATVEEFNAKTKALNEEQEQYQKHLEAVAEERKGWDKLRADYEAKQSQERADFEHLRNVHAENVKAAMTIEAQAQRVLDQDQQELRQAQNEHSRLTAELAKPLADHCPTCEQLLPEDRRQHVMTVRLEVEAKRAEWEKDIVTAQLEIAKDTEDLRVKTLHRQDVEGSAFPSPVFPPFQAPASLIPAFNASRLNSLRADLDFLDVDAARATLTAADQAQVRIEELTKQLADLQATTERERNRESQLRAELRPELEAELAEAQQALETSRAAYRETQGREARASAALEQAQRRLEELAKDLQAVDALKTALAGLQDEAAQWRLLELACSDKGIQALELDAVAPSIAAIANGLLRDAFGSRYQLEFETTRLSGTGKAQKQIEDFLIFVLDAETGDRQEISTLSGGEAVWIRRALYDAFGLIRARSTGLQFLTVFQDEADGALDPEARLTYLRMLESAHRQAGRRHTVIITHSAELQELITARVEVAKLKARAKQEAAA